MNLVNFYNLLADLFFMLRSLAKLELQTNFDAISKNVKILKIGPVELKLWKIREMTVVGFAARFFISMFFTNPQEWLLP